MKHELSIENSALVLIDVQEKLFPHIFNNEKLGENIAKLVKSLKLIGVPIIVTEQYPKGLGKTIAELNALLDGIKTVEKTSFDCFGSKEFFNFLKNKNKNIKNIILAGIESHVCILQAAISAISAGYAVHLVADAISSRKETDYETALRRLENEGAKIASTEMVIFQLMKDSKYKGFKKISEIIR